MGLGAAEGAEYLTPAAAQQHREGLSDIFVREY